MSASAPPEKKIPKTLDGLPSVVQHALLALTPQRRKFVMSYCGRAKGNATLAAQHAGVKGTDRTQAVVASQWMTDRGVRYAIEQWMMAFAMSAAQVTWEINDLAHANIGPFFELDPVEGKLRLKKVMDAEVWESHKHWIKSIRLDPETGQVVDLELHDALAAKNLLSKILKLHTDAPIVQFNFAVQQMSDAEVLKALSVAQGDMGISMLPPGAQVADVPAPTDKDDDP